MRSDVLRTCLILFINLVVLGVTLTACAGSGSESSQPAMPVANITSPQTGRILTVGEEILVTFNAADVKGIAQVELSIDGQAVMVEMVEPPVNSYTASYRWTAKTAGSHIIELRAFNVENNSGDPVQVIVTVAEAVSVASATPTATPTFLAIEDTPIPVVVNTPTVPVLPTATSVDSGADSTTGEPTVTALVGLNIRMGPSTDYSVIGILPADESARIIGRDEFSNWWQIEYLSDSGDRGWVAAGDQFSTAANAETVPVVQAPPLERVAPTPTPTGPPPTPTPDSLKPTIYSFTADRYSINAGESVVLSWDLANAQVAYLRYGDVEEGVPAPSSKTFSLDEDTKFILIARNDAGETTAELTVKVAGPTPTSVPVWRDGKVRIASGQYVDFDQGFVQSESGGGVDFYWSGQQQRFFPQDGAAGALLSRSYDEITLDDCRAVSYGQPIVGVDGSTQVKGCYITNEGRYGKFLISEWDLAANLTIQWLTWDYRQ